MPLTTEDRKLIVDEVTAAVVAAIKPAEVKPAAIVTEPPAAEAKKPAADAIPFEGDKADPKAIEAHLQKVQMKQLQDSADLSTPEGVIAYQKALAKLTGKVEDVKVPKTNAVPAGGVTGAEDAHEFTAEETGAAVARMTKKK